ncbi:hypothetical protein BGZ68_003682 [Mortierella alpina]|nr:hypothetical protein BGZ68_003682 [Mortierella alpina]
MTFNNLRVKAKGRILVNLALIAALLLSGMVANVTPILAADSRAAAAVDARAAKPAAMDRDAQYAGFEDLASHHRFQRHSEQHEKRASSEEEEGNDAKVPVESECLCDTKGPICGSTFDMTCGYVSDALFNCEDVGKEPVLDKRCPSKFCESGEKECGTLTPCICKGPGQICGSSFGPKCQGIDADSLYYCSGAGSVPSEIESCKSDSDSKSTELCPRDATGCASKVCFSTFPESCGYQTDGVYSCVTVGEPPIFVESCSPSKCIPVIGDGLGRCDIDPCLCSYTNDRLCGTDFPEECGYNPAAIYTCPEQPARPQLVNACPANNKCANTERGPACQP